MLSPEQVATVRRLFFAEHWKVGTIATELGVHRSAVCHALYRGERKLVPPRPSPLDPYLEFLRATLDQHPRLVSTRLYEMLRPRGYAGTLRQLKRKLPALRPAHGEPFLRLRTFPGEQAQVDWAHFGQVSVGRARRSLMAFVMTLSYCRALYVEFFFDQSQESFLLGHVRAFAAFGGAPREILYDNLRSAVLERCGQAIRFHPRLIELSAHYHFQPRACQVRRGNEKGRVERAIRYIRDSFFAARPFTTLHDLNEKVRLWQSSVALARPWPDDPTRTVVEVFEEEKPRLLSLPQHPFDPALLLTVCSKKIIYVRFDRNDYSIPPEAVGRTLSLLASDTLVRILDGQNELARHARCFDAHRRVEDPAHVEALLKLKRGASAHTPSARLLAAVPQAEAFLEAAFERGEPAGSQVSQLLALLSEHGASELRAAIDEALARKTPRASSVAYLLQKRRRTVHQVAPLPVDLSRRPDLADLAVTPHEGRIYDELSDPLSDD
jgi:transposase